MDLFPHWSFVSYQGDRAARIESQLIICTPCRMLRGQLTSVTGTLTAADELPLEARAASASLRLTFSTILLLSQSLFPNAPPSLLPKKTSSVDGTYMGASWANANVSLEAISSNDGDLPRISRKPLSKIWKKGGAVEVGLKVTLNADSRKGPSSPITAKERGSTN